MKCGKLIVCRDPHVVDISHPGYEDQMGIVNKTLQEIGAFDKPMLTIFNKMDLYEAQSVFDPMA